MRFVGGALFEDVNPQKINRKMFNNCLSTKIVSLENFWPYGIYSLAVLSSTSLVGYEVTRVM